MQFKMSTWKVNTEENTLTDSTTNRQYRIEPRTMDVLLLLIKNAQKVVTRQEFLDEVWGNTIVAEEGLSRCISELRKTLGDKATSPTYIQTLHKKGYKLLIKAEAIESPPKNNEPTSVDNSLGDHTQLIPVKKKKSRLFILAIIALPILTILFFVYQMTPLFGTPNSTDNFTQHTNLADSNNFTTTDIETLRQNLLNLTSQRVIVTLQNDTNNLLSFNVVSENEMEHNPDNTTFIIQNSDQQTLWELSRNVSTETHKNTALDDVLLVLTSIQTSYLYQVDKNLPPAIQQKYQQALYFVDKRGAENLDKAILLFDEVINHSPDFVEAIINKAAAIRNLNFYRIDLEDRNRRIIEFDLLLKQAASINPNHPVVKAVNAKFDINKKNWRDYEQTLQNAVIKSPNCYICVRFLAEFYVNVGYFQKAVNVIEENINYFPLSRQMHALLGEIYARQHDISKAQEQSNILKALGSENATDSLAIDINIHSQLGDVELVRQLLTEFVEKHPKTEYHLTIFETKMNGNYEEMRQLVDNLPYLDFNLGLAAGKIDDVYERLYTNVNRGNIRDLGLLHGWLHGKSKVHKFYPDALLALKNHSKMEDFLTDTGIIDYWEENGQWPDYCEQDRYLEQRPTFCPTSNRMLDITNNR